MNFPRRNTSENVLDTDNLSHYLSHYGDRDSKDEPERQGITVLVCLLSIGRREVGETVMLLDAEGTVQATFVIPSAGE